MSNNNYGPMRAKIRLNAALDLAHRMLDDSPTQALPRDAPMDEASKNTLYTETLRHIRGLFFPLHDPAMGGPGSPPPMLSLAKDHYLDKLDGHPHMAYMTRRMATRYTL